MSPRDLAKRCLFTVLRAGFRLTPMPISTRDRLRQRFLERHAELVPQGPRGQVADASHTGRRLRRHAAGHAIGYMPHRADTLPT
ncbi:MAG TPA: hypothetical protein VN624_11040, partial [Rhodanobacter sp.]|nr:hypothetical protein [Rhodanobacter sp.]